MRRVTPKVCIEGREMPYIGGSYTNAGSLTAATLEFTLPLEYAGTKKLWNKEVTFYLNESDTTPIFRGWIKRTNPDFNQITIRAEDALGYMLKGGESSLAKVVLTDTDNLDGLSASAGIVKLIKMAKLDSKLKTDMIGNTSPVVGSTKEPFRGYVNVLDVVKTYLNKAVNTDGSLPIPNIARIVDDGTYSQLVIELESDISSETALINHVYTEANNITNLSIINRKVPTIITVRGKGDVLGTFTHDTAIDAFDRNYFEVTNEDIESPAEAKDFAAKVFEANLALQYEYGIETFEGGYLSENDIIKVQTDNPEFSGNYRVIGKQITFSPRSFNLGLTINKRPPVLAEYIASLDN